MKKEEKPHTNANVLFEFEVPEYNKYHRGFFWYIGALIVAGLLITYALITQNFLFAVLIVLFGFIIFLHQIREPKTRTCRVTDSGIYVGEKHYPYKSFESFWIVYDPPEVKNLYLDLGGFMKSRLSIPIGEADPTELRGWMRKVVLEDMERDDEPMSDLFGRVFKL